MSVWQCRNAEVRLAAVLLCMILSHMEYLEQEHFEHKKINGQVVLVVLPF